MPKHEAKKLIDKAVAKAGKKDLRKYAGILKTDIDPLEYQKRMRNEWIPEHNFVSSICGKKDKISSRN